MVTALPRPPLGARIRVLPGTDGYDDREGTVTGFDVPAPRLTRDRTRAVGQSTWDLRVTFPADGPLEAAFDMDEVRVVPDDPDTRRQSVELAIEHLRMTVVTARAVDCTQSVVNVDELAALLDEHDKLRGQLAETLEIDAHELADPEPGA